MTIHTLDPATEGWAIRGALTLVGDRLHGAAGECGPLGVAGCSSSANWPTDVHRRQCPGVLFSLRLDGTDFQVTHAFSQLDVSGLNPDGYHPFGTLGLGPDGWLYGVTQVGGTPQGLGGRVGPGTGVLFRLNPATNEFEVLHHFSDLPRAFDGQYPMGAVAVDRRGCVYGTCKGAGALDSGTVWRWSPGGPFVAAPLTGECYGGVALTTSLLHGATWRGGDSDAGVYFVADLDTLAVRVVASFPTFPRLGHADDNTPIQEPTALSDGSVVTPREFGGALGTGAIYSLDPARGIRALWEAPRVSIDDTPRFSNDAGGILNGRIVEGPDGLLYGCSQYGGANGTGAIYRLARNGTRRQLLHSFPDAAYPYGGPTFGPDGALYGTTFGTGRIWRLDVSGD